MAATRRVFISHASVDKPLVEELVDLFQVGISVGHTNLFCTSLEGLGIPKGVDFKSFIHDRLQDPALVVMVVTPSYYESAFCLCELGAAWAMSHSCFPLLVPPIGFDDLKAVLVNSQVSMIDNPASLDALRDRVVERLEMASPAPTARWSVKRDEFLRELPTLLKDVRGYTKVSAEKYAQSQAAYQAAQEILTERKCEIEELRRTIERLKAIKDREEVVRVLAEDSGEQAKYEGLRKAAKSCLGVLPKVVVEAVFYHFYGGSYWPIEDPWAWDMIHRAEENGFLEVSTSGSEDGAVKPNKQDRKVLKAVAAITNLQDFLEGKSASVTFHEHFEETHGFPADIKNRRFWTGALGLD